MASGPRRSLNESGEMLVTRIVRGAALHMGRGERTFRHAHYAWKVHVGLDAPVWLESDSLVVASDAGARVVVVPPGLEHRVGAQGWSCTVLAAPGIGSTPWRGVAEPVVHDGVRAHRIVDACRSWHPEDRDGSAGLTAEVVRIACEAEGRSERADVRVRRALAQLSRDPSASLSSLALAQGVSLDRLSHLVTQDTGTVLRRHALWSRLVRFLSSNKQYTTIAAAAADAGFADHAHMTRTYRALLGRLPSEFKQQPDTVEPWSGQ